MERDRKEICKIISDMLDNPDKNGIYPTSTAYTRLEYYIEGERIKAIGWAHADACITLDRKGEPRGQDVPDILARAIKDLQ